MFSTPPNDPDRWYHKINPCDYARIRLLAPVGDLLAQVWRVFTYDTECPCCLGARLVVYTALVATVARMFPA